MEIDIFCHIIPPKYAAAAERLSPEGPSIRDHINEIPTTNDWEHVRENLGEISAPNDEIFSFSLLAGAI